MSRYPRAIAGRGGFKLTKGMFLPPFNDRTFPVPLLDLPLTTTIVPRNSVAVPSFSRNSIASVTDWEGIVRTALANEARFQGARRVRNFLIFTNDIFGNAAWTTGTVLNPKLPGDVVSPEGTTAGVCKFVLNDIAGNRAFGQASGFTAVIGSVTVFSFWVYIPSSNSNNSWSAYSFTGGDVPVDPINLNALPRNQWVRVRYQHTWVAAGIITCQFHGNFADTVGDRIYVWRPQLEDVTGQSNKNPGEYVSVGALAAPYQGANVDGVQYFDYQNLNTVSGNNIVTVSTAAPTALSTCMYWPESQKINSCLQSEDVTVAPWADTVGGTSTKVNSLATTYRGGGNEFLITNTSINGGVRQSIVVTAVNNCISFYLRAGTETSITFALENGVAAYGSARQFTVNLTTGVASAVTGNAPIITAYKGGWLISVDLGVAGGLLLANCEWRNANNGTTFFLGMPQLEASAAFPSTYIPTGAAAVTRLIDGLTYPNAGSMNATQGSCYAEAQTEWTSNESSVWLVGTDGNGRMLFISGPGAPPSNSAIKDAGAGTASGVGASMFGAIKKSGSTWNGIVGKAYYEGAAVGTGVLTGAMSLLTNIGIGCQGGGGSNGWSGGIRNVKIWDRALSDAQMKSIVGSI